MLSGSLPISLLSYSVVSMAFVLLVLNLMSLCFIVQFPEHLVKLMVLFFQLTSGLCLTSQSCPKNMSVPFKSITATSNYSLWLLILISRNATLVTSLFFIPSVLKTSNEKLIGFICILLSLTSCCVCVSRIHQYFHFQVLAIACLYFCLHVQFLLSFSASVIQNNIFILGIYMGDLLYCAYLRLLPKPYFFLSSSSSDSSWTLRFFIDYISLQSLAICSSLLHLKHHHLSSFFFNWHSFTMYLYLLQLKHFSFPSLKLLLDFLMFIG